jgi:subtilisin family serine protease
MGDRHIPRLLPLLLVVLLVPVVPAEFGPPFDPSLNGGGVALLATQPGRADAVAQRLAVDGLAAQPYPDLDLVAAVLPADRARWAARIPGVTAVWANEAVEAPAQGPPSRAKASLPDPVPPPRTGPRVGVIVVDTGVDGTHPDLLLGGRLVQNAAPRRLPNGLIGGIDEDLPHTDPDGHGTHVASILARHAPDAALIGFRAARTDPRTGEPKFDAVAVLAAYQYALDHADRYGVRVVTNSWGSSGAFDPDGPVARATFKLYRAGIVVLFAAGNQGGEGPGHLNKHAVAPWVLAIGSATPDGQRSGSSSIGTNPAHGKPYDHPDLLAPGLLVWGARAAPLQDGVPQPDRRGEAYLMRGGTSMATPHVAAAAARLVEARPDLSPDEVYDLLIATARPVPGGRVWEVGAGLLNAEAALAAAPAAQGLREEFFAGAFLYGGRASGDPAHARDAVALAAGTHFANAPPAAPPAALLPFALALAGLLLLPAARRGAGPRLSPGRALLGATLLGLVAASSLVTFVGSHAEPEAWTGAVLAQDPRQDAQALGLALVGIVGLALLVGATGGGSGPAAARILAPLLLGLALTMHAVDLNVAPSAVPGGLLLFLRLAPVPLDATTALLAVLFLAVLVLARPLPPARARGGFPDGARSSK